MKRILLIIFWLIQSGLLFCQPEFFTIAPDKPLRPDEPFTLQFIFKNAEQLQAFTPPAFDAFQLIKKTDRHQPVAGSVKNIVYTLLPLRTGTFIIGEATAIVDGKKMKTAPIKILVKNQLLQQLKTSRTDDVQILLPGENANEKIRRNLFVRLLLSKKTCFIGEPIVATYKLYTRLQAESDIEKNPGFYGFSIYDMQNLDNAIKTTETIQGKLFDVYTVRKLQLYPLQAGVFSIDPMEIRNTVFFKKLNTSDSSFFETFCKTDPATIYVNPLPATKSDAISIATGKFSIVAGLEKNKLLRNEEGFLTVTIKGQGNFTQINAPTIYWPQGVEAFEPTVTEQLDKESVPLKGEKTFRYSFTAASGAYILPAIVFDFFDPDSLHIRKLKTKPLQVTISTIEKEKTVTTTRYISIDALNRRASLIAAALVALGLIAVIFYLTKKKTETVVSAAKPVLPKSEATSIFQPVYENMAAPTKDFYTGLQQALFRFFAQQLQVNEQGLNRQTLMELFILNNTKASVIEKTDGILSDCEVGIYTGIETNHDRSALLETIRQLLHEIDADTATQR